MRLWIDAALSVLFAPECPVCATPLAHPSRGAVCEGCWQSILPLTPPLCDRCGDAISAAATTAAGTLCQRCRRDPPPIERTRSVGTYDGVLRDIVHALKYDGRRSLAGPLGVLLRDRCRDILMVCDIAVPVPLHAAKRRERGFNQAEDLAKAVGLPVVKALRRLRRTAAQADLSAEARVANVAFAFGVTRHAARLRGHTVVLVDDVTTTGATLNACAMALQMAGIDTVYAVTAARAAMKWR